MKRSSGILMAVSSPALPYGIGTLGKAAYDFADFLKDAGQSYWQMLPLGPHQLWRLPPTRAFSAYAGNPYYIDPDMLAADGLLTAAECAAPRLGQRPAPCGLRKDLREPLYPAAQGLSNGAGSGTRRP